MKDTHILEILDGKPFAELNADETALIQSHSATCAMCEKAFEAARVSSVLLKFQAERSAAVQPSPFFEAKVMNALRARADLKKPIAAFRRWWQASFAPVCAMLLMVASLAALSLLAPRAAEEDSQAVVPNNLYTTDAVIMNQGRQREMTNEQVFRVIYNPRYETDRK